MMMAYLPSTIPKQWYSGTGMQILEYWMNENKHQYNCNNTISISSAWEIKQGLSKRETLFQVRWSRQEIGQ